MNEDTGFGSERLRDGHIASPNPCLVCIFVGDDQIGRIVKGGVDGVAGVEDDDVAVGHDLFGVL